MAHLREIETLARLQLEARRSGVALRAEVPDAVRDLVAFCGLEDVLSPLFAPVWPPRHWTRGDGDWEACRPAVRRRAAAAARTAGRASRCRGRS